MMKDVVNKIVKNIIPHATHNGIFTTPITDLEIIRSDCPTHELHVLHKPAICIVLQGKKRVMLGQEVFEYDQSKYLSVSFDLPLTGQVIEASPDTPYLCLKLNIDIPSLSALVMDISEDNGVNTRTTSGLNIEKATLDILDPIMRLSVLLNHPNDIKILTPTIKREIYYRILTGPNGHHLKAQASSGGKSKQIGKAINWIKENFNQSYKTDDVAREVHLSPSTFHKYFKLITLMSPLQFQKKLRLQEARRLMVFEGVDAAEAGSIVGYESATQFNREYKRAFGAPPKADVSVLIKENIFCI